MGKYFGTDGVRAVAGQFPLVDDFIQKLGYAALRELQEYAKTHQDATAEKLTAAFETLSRYGETARDADVTELISGIVAEKMLQIDFDPLLLLIQCFHNGIYFGHRAGTIRRDIPFHSGTLKLNKFLVHIDALFRILVGQCLNLFYKAICDRVLNSLFCRCLDVRRATQLGRIAGSQAANLHGYSLPTSII